MILTVKPQEFIVPIHTEKPDIGEYSEKIKILDDSGIVEV